MKIFHYQNVIPRLFFGFGLMLGAGLLVAGEEPKETKPAEAEEADLATEPVAPVAPASGPIAPAPSVEEPAAPLPVSEVPGEKPEPTAPLEKPQEKPSEKKWAEPERWANGMKDGNGPVILHDRRIPIGEKSKQDVMVIMGDLTVDGEVDGDAVAILGDVVVNGTVSRNVIAIKGDVRLGPKARVAGNIVCPQGSTVIDPGAYVGGKQIQQEAFEEKLEAFRSWWTHALKWGRPIAIAAHMGWLWIFTGFMITFYALLGLLFPRALRSCGDQLTTQPGFVILAAMLTVLALPVLFVLLLITVIGIPVAVLLLPLLVFCAVLFGKAAIYGLVGRWLTGNRLHLALAVIAGALLFLLLYLVPIVGILLSLLVALLGFGCVILTLFSPRASGTTGPVPVAPSGIPLGTTVAEPAPPMLPPVNSPALMAGSLYPRAGFWVRLGATFLDVILVAILVSFVGGMLHRLQVDLEEGLPLWFAIYFVVLWATKGTTLGGIICGLKVVRLDDRPLDWSVAIVRGLSAFLSLAVAGLGFIWVAFDDDKQSWHDKIAGTTIVKVPKGTPLL